MKKIVIIFYAICFISIIVALIISNKLNIDKFQPFSSIAVTSNEFEKIKYEFLVLDYIQK